MGVNNSAYSNMKVLYHTDRIEKLIRGERCAPVYIRIKPTNRCNQKCYYCFYDDNNNENVYETKHTDRRCEISWDKMREILSDASEMKVKAITFTGGGEPLVYGHIVEAAQMVLNSGMDLALITNGQALLTDKADIFSNAKWVRVSIDSADEETYKKIRCVSTFKQVISNIEKFAKIKNPSCALGANCVVNEHNYTKVYEMCRLYKSIGIENVKFSPVNEGLDIFDNNRRMRAIVEEQLQRAKEELVDDQFKLTDKYGTDISLRENYVKPYDYCWVRHLFTVIAADSKVYNCIDKAYIPAGELGDLTNQSFKEMWFSEETTKKFEKLDVHKECEFRCIYDDRNRILDSVMSLDKNHVNFI